MKVDNDHVLAVIESTKQLEVNARRMRLALEVARVQGMIDPSTAKESAERIEQASGALGLACVEYLRAFIAMGVDE